MFGVLLRATVVVIARFGSLEECFSMTLSDILTAVTGFVEDWTLFIAAGMVVRLGSMLLRRLIRSGR
jgi:hypothetical protein